MRKDIWKDVKFKDGISNYKRKKAIKLMISQVSKSRMELLSKTVRNMIKLKRRKRRIE